MLIFSSEPDNTYIIIQDSSIHSFVNCSELIYSSSILNKITLNLAKPNALISLYNIHFLSIPFYNEVNKLCLTIDSHINLIIFQTLSELAAANL